MITDSTWRAICLAIIGLVLLASASPLQADDHDGLPTQATPFAVTGTDGQSLALAENPSHQLTVICFLGTECPLAKLYAGRLQKIADELDGQSVRFLGLNSNRQDSADELKRFVADQKIQFSCGKDFDNVIADQLEVRRTPEVIVVDQSRKIRYRGRIDDQYSPGVSRSRPERHDLKIAIEELLAGKPVSVPKTEPEGCLLGRVTKPVANATVTWCNQVSRVIQNHCVECHHAGDIGPFSLTDYDEAIGWGDMMVEVIDNGRMPPWHADPKIGKFTNGRHMPASDKQVIKDWVDQGMPYGDSTKLPDPVKFASGWQLGREPDRVIAMRDRPFTVPADGTVEYQYFVVDPGFEEDVWVANAEVIPGNRSIVHHSIVFIRPPDGTEFTGIGWLGAYVPGQRLPITEPNLARRIPKGSRLVFQQHYTPNGTAQSDITKIGLVFADPNDVTQERLTLTAMNQGFELKPERAGQVVKASVRRLPSNGRLLGIAPHMHYRGNQFSAAAVSKDSKDQTAQLLRVPDYDFNWQHNYELAEPLDLADIERIETSFVFDNSDSNPFNPDASSYVTWGDQTWEEMAIAFFDVARPRKSESKKLDETKATKKEFPEDRYQQKLTRQTQKFLQRFDLNNDGAIQEDELPLSIRFKEFNRSDSNHDGKVDREELMDQFRRRL
jgi:peroxiredoxin